MNRTHSQSILATATLGLAAFGVSLLAGCSNSASGKPNYIYKDPPKAGVVAKIGNDEITEEQLIGDEKLDFFELKKREYDLKQERLKKLIVEKLVGAEAQKAGMPLEEYITKKVIKGDIKISDAEVTKFAKEKRIPEGQVAQLKDRIIAFMQQEKKQNATDAYVAKLTKSTPVEVYFKKPRMDVKVDIGGAPVWGKDSAPVTIIEYSDFQCPFCAQGAVTVSELKKKYGGKVKIAFKHFPLPMHPQAKPASEIGMCVNDQGSDKFWKYHDIVFKKQDKMDDASLLSYAKEAGADEKKVDECYKSGKHKEFVAKDMEYGEKVGVRSTPTFFINGQIVSGAVPIEAFSEIIDDELALAK